MSEKKVTTSIMRLTLVLSLVFLLFILVSSSTKPLKAKKSKQAVQKSILPKSHEVDKILPLSTKAEEAKEVNEVKEVSKEKAGDSIFKNFDDKEVLPIKKKDKKRRKGLGTSKLLKTKRPAKTSIWEILKSFIISLYDPTCGGQIEPIVMGSLLGSSSADSFQTGVATPTFGAVCGPNGCV